MKDKIMSYGIISLIFLTMIFLMLVSDGVFGEKTKNMLGWIVLAISIVFLLACVIANIYNKLKNK